VRKNKIFERNKLSKIRKMKQQNVLNCKRRQTWTTQPSISSANGTGSRQKASSLQRRERVKRAREERKRRSEEI